MTRSRAGGGRGGDWAASLPFSTVVHHRVTALFRNLEETVFPERATPAGLANAKSRAFDALAAAAAAARKPVRFFEGSYAELAAGREGGPPPGYFSGLPVPPDPAAARWDQASFADWGHGAVTAVVNAEDHVALYDRSGGPFRRQWKTLDALAARVAEVAPFARSEEYGYLAADPDHVGTGLALWCDMSLFGLFVARDLDPALRALERLGFDAEPVFTVPAGADDGGVDAPGCRYWISSTHDAGSAEDVVARMDAVCREVARQEQNARLRLLRTKSPDLADFVSRSLAAGAFAVTISWAEAVDLALAVLFAADLGMIRIGARERAKLEGMPEALADEALARNAPEGADLRVERASAAKPVFFRILARATGG